MNLTQQFEYRLKRKQNFDKQAWIKHLSENQIDKQLMDKLVLNFLIKEGYKQAATDFAEEAGLEVNLGNELNMHQKHNIRQLLLSERIEDCELLLDIKLR